MGSLLLSKWTESFKGSQPDIVKLDQGAIAKSCILKQNEEKFKETRPELFLEPEKIAYFQFLVVEKSHRGNGLMRPMFDAGHDISAMIGCEWVYA